VVTRAEMRDAVRELFADDSDGRLEVIVDVSCGVDATRCFLSGLKPNNVPLVLVEIGRGNLYTMDLKAQ
jgi:hypothetical protein